MFGMQTASGVRKLLVRQIRCKAQTLLKRLQTWSLASFKLGRILDPENTVTKSFSTLSAQTGPAESARERNGSFRRWKRGTGRWGKPQPQPTGALGASSISDASRKSFRFMVRLLWFCWDRRSALAHMEETKPLSRTQVVNGRGRQSA